MSKSKDLKKELSTFTVIFAASYFFMSIIAFFAIIVLNNSYHQKLAQTYTMAAKASFTVKDIRQAVSELLPSLERDFLGISLCYEDHKPFLNLPNDTSLNSIKGSLLVSQTTQVVSLNGSSNSALFMLDFYYSNFNPLIVTFLFELLLFLFFMGFFRFFKKRIEDRHSLDLKHLELEIIYNLSKQVSHDIRSPLSVLNAIAGTMVDMPEDKRILLRSAANRINDIANQLLQKNKTESTTKTHKDNKINELIKNEQGGSALTTELLSSIVDVMVSEKRIQFREKASVVIEADLEESYGAFAAIDSAEFKRVLSNLINNSVEALKKENGRVVVSVKNYSHKKIVTVRDNGNGIPQHILEKLGEKGITHGKEGTESGSGLGVYHAKKTIESFGGNFIIQSREGLGTEIRMEFPSCETPNWFVPEIPLSENKTIVALDDDQSVLEVWKQRFSGLSAPVPIVAFTSGNEFNTWIESNSELTAQAIFLMDYELIGQRFTGLDLIEENKLGDRAILVTSRYEEPQIRKRCENLGVRLIPKSMAGYVPIEVLRHSV